MKYLLLLLFVLLFFQIILAQSFQEILNKTKTLAQTDTYDRLLKRYFENDSSLTLEEYTILYYGEAFRNNYQPYAFLKSNVTFSDAFNAQPRNYRKILDEAMKINTQQPFNMNVIAYIVHVYDKMEMKDSSNIWRKKFDMILRAILSSGDGKSFRSAFVVTKIIDEYALLNFLNLRKNIKSQSLIFENEKPYDVFTLSRNPLKFKKIYFDVSLFFGKN